MRRGVIRGAFRAQGIGTAGHGVSDEYQSISHTCSPDGSTYSRGWVRQTYWTFASMTSTSGWTGFAAPQPVAATTANAATARRIRGVPQKGAESSDPAG